ncbi:hypothetical protein GOM49_00600 [Clostridium bovifaecis]|uniref:Uncharacterized protein n=1 Tax=Clostridium bovifaecis TaxID=2184719 RepID=A0A6I6EJJ5_9CLOT|nr:hypothetical protein GOM49_00600 [Clostridium bovifaecis]
MYKETVVRRKVPSIFIIVILLAVSIVVSDIIINIQVGEYKVGGYLTILLACIIFLLIIMQINKCSVKYKYSIIADELIIYKLKGSRQEVMESIKIKDIEDIIKVDKITSRFRTILCKKYSCLNITNNLYACMYNNGHMRGKFYFEPSCKLIDKLDILKKKDMC